MRADFLGTCPFFLARSHWIVGIFSSPTSIAIADSDPRMSQIVIHGGIVYLSGQVDQEATDAEGQTKGKQSRHIA
jgi:enamine deaminase RidA (YjgF/YER057c/UK114 family)